VTEHGGRLWAEQRPEGGVAFFLELPLEELTTEE
jgi:signal transduction histidine kinase